MTNRFEEFLIVVLYAIYESRDSFLSKYNSQVKLDIENNLDLQLKGRSRNSRSFRAYACGV